MGRDHLHSERMRFLLGVEYTVVVDLGCWVPREATLLMYSTHLTTLCHQFCLHFTVVAFYKGKHPVCHHLCRSNIKASVKENCLAAYMFMNVRFSLFSHTFSSRCFFWEVILWLQVSCVVTDNFHSWKALNLFPKTNNPHTKDFTFLCNSCIQWCLELWGRGGKRMQKGIKMYYAHHTKRYKLQTVFQKWYQKCKKDLLSNCDVELYDKAWHLLVQNWGIVAISSEELDISLPFIACERLLLQHPSLSA